MPVLDRAVAMSDQHRLSVRDSLQLGVQEALTRLTRAFSPRGARRRAHRQRAGAGHRYARTNRWSSSTASCSCCSPKRAASCRSGIPVFRDGYTIEALRTDVERLPRPAGLWESLQAISRLAHRGCRAGSLRVPPFNGRLFSPAHAPLADVLAAGRRRRAAGGAGTDDARRHARRSGRERIAYGDLGVEQLGGVYERLLDFQLPRGLAPLPPDTGGARPPDPSTRRDR